MGRGSREAALSNEEMRLALEVLDGWRSKLHADKAYDHVFCRMACRIRGIAPRIARRGVEAKDRLGRHRWVVERTFAWLHGAYRRLATRYERRAEIHEAFLSLGAALICLNHVQEGLC